MRNLHFANYDTSGNNPVNATAPDATAYSVNGVKVLGARDTGWTAFGATVTANKSTYDPAASYAAGVTYLQAEAAAVAAALVAANARIKALEAAMRAHGLIN